MIIIVAALWFQTNAEFVKTANEQMAEGYRWVEVGKSDPSGTPAITTVSNIDGREYIYYRLEK